MKHIGPTKKVSNSYFMDKELCELTKIDFIDSILPEAVYKLISDMRRYLRNCNYKVEHDIKLTLDLWLDEVDLHD